LPPVSPARSDFHTIGIAKSGEYHAGNCRQCMKKLCKTYVTNCSNAQTFIVSSRNSALNGNRMNFEQIFHSVTENILSPVPLLRIGDGLYFCIFCFSKREYLKTEKSAMFLVLSMIILFEERSCCVSRKGR
jgi:hypothetical protein